MLLWDADWAVAICLALFYNLIFLLYNRSGISVAETDKIEISTGTFFQELFQNWNGFCYFLLSKHGGNTPKQNLWTSFTSHFCTFSTVFHQLSPWPCAETAGILMLSQTMDNLGDFLCASVIWFCPEAVLFQSFVWLAWAMEVRLPSFSLSLFMWPVWMSRLHGYCNVI